MTGARFAVVGATGAVGRRMVRVLESRGVPVASLRLFASERSTGVTLPFRGDDVAVSPFDLAVLESLGADIALLALPADVSREAAPALVRGGAIVVDNSSAFRLDPNVPLVIPEVNLGDLADHHGIVANPNCSTIQMLVALAPLHRRYGLTRVVVATYQSASGVGQDGIAELEAEEKDAAYAPVVFPRRLHRNVLPLVDTLFEDGTTREERKMADETRKMLHDPSIGVIATCVRVPVPIGHSEAIVAEFRSDPDPAEARRLLTRAPGVRVIDDVSTGRVPIADDCVDSDDVLVGRIRRDPTAPRSLALWCVADNLRKGAATNAIQIAEALLAAGGEPAAGVTAPRSRAAR